MTEHHIDIGRVTAAFKAKWPHPERRHVADPELKLAGRMLKESKAAIDGFVIAAAVFLDKLQEARRIVTWTQDESRGVAPKDAGTGITFWQVCERVEEDPARLRRRMLDPIAPSLKAILLNTPNVCCPCCGRKE